MALKWSQDPSFKAFSGVLFSNYESQRNVRGQYRSHDSMMEFVGNYFSLVRPYCVVIITIRTHEWIDRAGMNMHTNTHTRTNTGIIHWGMQEPMLGVVSLCWAFVKDLHNDQLNLLTAWLLSECLGSLGVVCVCECTCTVVDKRNRIRKDRFKVKSAITCRNVKYLFISFK